MFSFFIMGMLFKTVLFYGVKMNALCYLNQSGKYIVLSAVNKISANYAVWLHLFFYCHYIRIHKIICNQAHTVQNEDCSIVMETDVTCYYLDYATLSIVLGE